MTKPEDQTPAPPPDRSESGGPTSSGNGPAAPRPAAPSWVDEVLRAGNGAPPPSAPRDPGADLRLPETPRPAPATAEPGDLPPLPSSPPAPTVIMVNTRSPAEDDDWITQATGGTARAPVVPTGPQVSSPPPAWDLSQREGAASAGVPGDVTQKKLIAGVLAIVLGSLGVHKFYLGMNTPGLVMLAVNVGVWILAVLLGLLTLGLGLIITVPLAALISGAIGLLGLIEGVLYLTKSDGDFYREYVLGKKPWL